jgi:DNA repair protein RadA/Sms
LGGEPGIESTFAPNLLKLPYKTLYVSGEESQKQIKKKCAPKGLRLQATIVIS